MKCRLRILKTSMCSATFSPLSYPLIPALSPNPHKGWGWDHGDHCIHSWLFLFFSVLLFACQNRSLLMQRSSDCVAATPFMKGTWAECTFRKGTSISTCDGYKAPPCSPLLIHLCNSRKTILSIHLSSILLQVILQMVWSVIGFFGAAFRLYLRTML